MPQRYKLFSIPPNFLRIICISEHSGIPFSSSKRHMSHGFREDFTIPSINILEETELDIASLAITIFSENCLHISNCFCMIYVHKPDFHPVKSMYHYNRIYNKHNERYLQQENFNVKRFLYYLRGVLACRWIEKNKSLPPVRFQELVDAMVTEKAIKTKIEEIIEMKKEGLEANMITIDSQLVDYVHKLAEYYNDKIGHYRPEQTTVSTDVLDSILFDMVKLHN